MHFQSKKDGWFFLIIWGFIIAIFLLSFVSTTSTGTQFIPADSIFGKILMILIIIPLIWIWFGTGYTIKDNQIKIKFGPIKSTVQIEDIIKINKAKNPFTAPALSINRLEIHFGKYDKIMLSPKNKTDFVNALLKVNPQIQIDEN